MYKVVLFFSLMLSAFTFYGQVSFEINDKEVINLYEIEENFCKNTNDETDVKGKGYKQFNRWKNFWEPRLFPSGDFSMNKINSLSEFSINKKSCFDKTNGSWESLGIDDWNSTSYSPGNGRVNTILQSPFNDSVIYSGTPSGGLWKSIDAGMSWSPLTDNLPTLGISDILIDYTNPDILYIATGDNEAQDTYGVGVLKSIDGGDSWNTTGLNWEVTDNKTCSKIIIHPTDPLILLCATSNGLFKTINGGLTWIVVLGGDINDVEYKSDNSEVVFATRKYIYRSINGGDDFSVINDVNLPDQNVITRALLAVTPANPNVVYYICSSFNYGFEGLYKSMDGGDSWIVQAVSPNVFSLNSSGMQAGGQAWYDMAIAVSPVDENLIVVGGINLWKSVNGGLDWNLNSYWFYEPGMTQNYVHADIHHLEFFGDKLYCGTDGGAFLSTDNGSSYQDISSGLVISQMTRLGVDPQNSDRVITGSQDNGTNLFNNNWQHVHGADGGECFLHPTNTSIVFCCIQNGGIRKSIDGGSSFVSATSGLTGAAAWTTPVLQSPLNPDYLYTARRDVFRSTSLGDSWSKISNIDELLHSLAIGMNDPNTIYTASYDDIYKTNNGGVDWENISLGLANEAITWIVVDPLNVEHVWVTFSGFNSERKVYRSENGGDNWENITDNLPNVPVNCIAFEDEGDNGVYIGTDNGIYYTNDLLAHWEPFMDGLPNVIVTELEVDNDGGFIFASTYGRGLWKSDLWELDSSPIADFSFSPAAVCVDEEVVFHDESSLNEPIWEWTFEGGEILTSTDSNPTVQYAIPGDYDVTLTVQNQFGETTSTCENCIHVFENESNGMLYFQSFENSNTLNGVLWFSDDVNDGWKITNLASVDGIQAMWIDNFGLNTEENYEVFSEPIFLNAEQAFLTFKYSYANIDDENNEKLRLYSSIDCGQSWDFENNWSGSSLVVNQMTNAPYIPGSDDDWVTEVVALDDDLLNQDVMFKFRFRNDNGNNIFIDDINITSTVIGVNSYDIIEVEVFPNPVSDRLFFKFNSNYFSRIIIYNESGQEVLQKPIEELEVYQLDLSKYADGFYSYSILSKNEITKTGKFIISK